MAMYTTAVCDKGLEWQFKYGDDQCETYRLNQPPKQGIYEPVPDNIYEGFLFNGEGVNFKGSYALLLIHGNRLLEVKPLILEEVVSSGGIEPMARAMYAKHSIPVPKDLEYWLQDEVQDFMWDNFPNGLPD